MPTVSVNVGYSPLNVSVKLDTLSKDDLIKFAKKQMGAMQKLKSKCAGRSSQGLDGIWIPFISDMARYDSLQVCALSYTCEGVLF